LPLRSLSPVQALRLLSPVQGKAGKETKGKEIKGKEIKGKETKGKEIKGKETKGKETKGKETKDKEIKGKETKDKGRRQSLEGGVCLAATQTHPGRRGLRVPRLHTLSPLSPTFGSRKRLVA
jgi:hypothetical protein